MRTAILLSIVAAVLQGCQPSTEGTLQELPESTCFNVPDGEVSASVIPDTVDCASQHTHQVLARINLLGSGSRDSQRNEADLACRGIVANSTGGRALPAGVSLVVVVGSGGQVRGERPALCILEFQNPRRGAL